MNIRVALCVPTASTWSSHTATSLIEAAVYSTVYGIGVKPLSGQCSLISLNRNMHVLEALKMEPKPTHLWWVDSDIICPPDALHRLLSHDKDIVGAFYSRRKPPYAPTGRLIKQPTIAELSQGGLHQADIMSGGMVLVKTEVYERLNAPWYFEVYDDNLKTDGSLGIQTEDTNFTRKAIAAGYEAWCDLDLTYVTGHVGETVIPCLRPTSPLRFMKANT